VCICVCVSVCVCVYLCGVWCVCVCVCVIGPPLKKTARTAKQVYSCFVNSHKKTSMEQTIGTTKSAATALKLSEPKYLNSFP